MASNVTVYQDWFNFAFLESRMVFRTLLHGFRVCLTSLKKCEAPTPDGTLIFRFFEGCIRCMSLFDPDPRMPEQNEPIEWFAHALTEINLHIFQEVWTHKIGFFFECAQKRIYASHSTFVRLFSIEKPLLPLCWQLSSDF